MTASSRRYLAFGYSGSDSGRRPAVGGHQTSKSITRMRRIVLFLLSGIVVFPHAVAGQTGATPAAATAAGQAPASTPSTPPAATAPAPAVAFRPDARLAFMNVQTIAVTSNVGKAAGLKVQA